MWSFVSSGDSRVDGVVLGLVYLLDVAILRSLPFLGIFLFVGDAPWFSCGSSGRYISSDYLQ